MKPILHQPTTTAPAPVSSAPASLLDDAPRTETPAALPDPIAPDRRLLSPPPRRAFRARATVSPPAPARCSKPAIFPWPGAARAGAAAGTAPVRRSRRRAARPVSPNLRDRLAAIRRRRAIPRSARRQGVEGITTLRLIVLATGRVGQIAVSRSAGHVDLDRAAVEAVRMWRFDPARRGKEAVAVWVTLPVRFELHTEVDDPRRRRRGSHWTAVGLAFCAIASATRRRRAGRRSDPVGRSRLSPSTAGRWRRWTARTTRRQPISPVRRRRAFRITCSRTT